MSEASLPKMELGERGVFTLILFAFVVSLLWTALDYSYRARLAPLAVGIPTAALLLNQALLDFLPRLAARFGGDSGTFVVSETSIAASDTADLPGLHWRELSIALWLVALLLGTTILGILATMPLFAFAYLRFWARETLTLSIIYSVFLWGSVYLLLVKVLSAQLPVPLIVEWLGS